MRRYLGGLYGWLASMAPLIVINGMGYVGLLNSQEAALAGAAALLGGPLLGGVVAGYYAGAPSRREPGGMASAAVAGGVASALYLAGVAGLLIAATQLGALPQIIADHPIRAGTAVVFLALILLAVAVAVGAWSGRGRATYYDDSRETPHTRVQPRPSAPRPPLRAREDGRTPSASGGLVSRYSSTQRDARRAERDSAPYRNPPRR